MLDTTRRDEEYYNRYVSLSYLILRAYLDVFFLDSIGNFKDSLPEKPEPTTPNPIIAVAHICELTKTDLALNLWKVFYDNNPKAITVKKLKDYLFRSCGWKVVKRDSPSIKKIESTIKTARNTFIAHNSVSPNGYDLRVDDLRAALDDIRAYFNELCSSDIDDRVNPLTDSLIYSLSFYEKLGFDVMLLRNLQQSSPNNSGGENSAE